MDLLTVSTAQPGAERSLESLESARAYLARHDDQDFIGALVAEWQGLRGTRFEVPPAKRTRIRALGHAKKLVSIVPRLGRALDVFIWNAQSGELGSTEFKRLLATVPDKTRFALVLANAAMNYQSHWSGRPDRRVSGQLAAVLAVAEGIEKHGADGIERVRRWGKAMARATRTMKRLRGT